LKIVFSKFGNGTWWYHIFIINISGISWWFNVLLKTKTLLLIAHRHLIFKCEEQINIWSHFFTLFNSQSFLISLQLNIVLHLAKLIKSTSMGSCGLLKFAGPKKLLIFNVNGVLCYVPQCDVLQANA
jgi:hypothetical protein